MSWAWLAFFFFARVLIAVGVAWSIRFAVFARCISVVVCDHTELVSRTKIFYAHLGAHISHAHLPILLSHPCDKVDLLCGLPKEKGEKVTASGRKKKTPLATLIGIHNPCTPT